MTFGVMTSCDKDTDPADVDVFAGTYVGKLTYNKVGGDKIVADEGKVTVTKIGSTYSFHFNKGIPDLTGIKFENKGSNVYCHQIRLHG